MKSRKSLKASQILATLKRNHDALKKYKVRKIGLFGSYASGKQTAKSDIDFLVEFDEPTFDNFMGLSEYLEKVLQHKIDLITNGNLSPYIQPQVDKEVKWHVVG